MKFYQATVVSHRNQGILIKGEPNSGKSSLALRLMARGAVLVADDCTYLEPVAPRLIAHHIPRIAGKVAVRRVGILNFKNLPFAEIKLVVDLSPVFRTKEGKMGNTVTKLCQVSLPAVRALSSATTVLDVEAALAVGYAPSVVGYAPSVVDNAASPAIGNAPSAVRN